MQWYLWHDYDKHEIQNTLSEPTKDTSHLVLMDELLGVFSECLVDTESCYNDNTL